MSEPSNPEPDQSAPESLAGTVMRGAGVAAIGFAGAQAVNLGFYVVLARLLSPSEFGTYAAATVLLGFSYLVSEGGLSSAVIQRRDRIEEAQSTAVVAMLTSGAVLSLLALAASPLIGLIFDSSEITAIAAVMSGTILISATGSIPDAILRRRFSQLQRIVIEPSQVVVFGTVSVIGALNDLGPWSLVIGQYAGFIVAVTLAWVLARWRPRLSQFSFGMWRELAAYGRHVFASSAILRIGEQAADTAIVGKGLGESALGQYRYAFRIASTPFQVILAGASYVIFPAFARIAADRDRLRAAILRSLRWMSIVGIPSGLILIPLGPALTVLVFGAVWLPAGNALIAMCAYTGANAIGSVAAEALKADGRPDRLVRIHALTAVVTAGTMLALLPLGLTAIAAGLSVGALAGAFASVIALREILDLDVASMWREIWPPLVASVIMVVALFPLDRLLLDPAAHGAATGFALIAGEAFVGTLLFVAVLRRLAPTTIEEFMRPIRSRRAAASAS